MIIKFIQEHQLNLMLELSGIAGVIFLFTLFTKYISKNKKKSMLIMCISSFILLRADRLAYIYRGDISTLGYWMVRICNFLVFASSLSLIYGFNEYLISFHSDDVMYSNNKKIPKILIVTKILPIIGILLLVISQFTNLYYYFDNNNFYHRGKWYILCYILPLVSLFIQFIIVLFYNKKFKKHIFIPLILFTIFPIVATIVQLFFYGISFTNLSCVGVVVLLYAFTIYDANLLIEEKGRIENELHIAKKIQLNECPNIFPAFPDREEFELYAIMNPAKEVGGDFYDYFLIDDDHLGLVMADVSGKGVPAALNMVKAKLLLKESGLHIYNPAKVLSQLNDRFIDNNKLDMFVTVWFGIFEISTGKLKFSNAGHEDLIIYNVKSGFDVYKIKHDIPIGTMKNYKYRNHELFLNNCDKLFLYTDGIIDAVNKDGKHYGIVNLLRTLNKNKDKNVEDIIKNVSLDLENYSRDCNQFDDITMLCFEFNGGLKNDKIIKLKRKFIADVNEINHVFNFFTEAMKKVIGTEKIKNYNIVIDEIFSNIAKYGFNKKNNDNYISIELFIDLEKRIIKIIFEDNGKQFNPLEKENPNINLSALERSEGGLGIYIVKKIMDKVSYVYKNNKNVFIIEKKY